MDNSSCLAFVDKVTLTEWIAIFAILANAIMAYWIVQTIQKNINNRRVLKDHFISEIKEIRTDYYKWLEYFYSKKFSPREVIPIFKLLSIKVNNCLDVVGETYSIEENCLSPFVLDLPEIITESEAFTSNFSKNTSTTLDNEARHKLIKFQQEHNKVFNKIIVGINNK